MNKDRGFAGLLLVFAAVYGGIWYYRRKNAFQGTTVDSIIGPVAIGDTPLAKMKNFADTWKLIVTSTTGGRHNKGSLHPLGRAIDVDSKGMSDDYVDRITQEAKRSGIQVIDERRRPAGQKVWSNPHLHLQIPY